ncbi:protein-glutamate methyltransferase [Roseomonas sp. SSH11]|uniref:protein-glutamate O-methyltransferase n=1 Tax=Pararoseomonas baculiformis TaxID=2820812 RepID=A0ABS4A8U9_9PROT|nr:protein-glutamate O-methyltransferase CheR [Pararoseomonas baculiformis]MBP0443420.1 protein-glutamate methyltransferase [Pararoseomonas baculiformis]
MSGGGRNAGGRAAPLDLPAQPPLADPAFAELKRLIVARTGHAYYADKDTALWERLRGRIRASGAGNAAGYAALLRHPADGEAEWAALESTITIGETFFFRDAGQFAALRDTILPGLIARRAGPRRLRIWSAGCSTGAEPYSVAILLRRLLGPAHREWSISILGTDISEAALDAARAARFSPWALRGMDLDGRMRDFLPVAGNQAWQLRPEHRGTTRFERQNLLGLLDGTLPLSMTGFDLILCRNVLIYFDRALVPRLVRALGERLAPDGWLLLGHAEPDPSFNAFLQPVTLASTTAWRPLPNPEVGVAEQADAPPAAWTQLPAPAPAAAAPSPWSWQPLPVPPAASPAPRATPQPAPEAPGEPLPLLDRARAEADSGALDAARATLREGLRDHPTHARMQMLDGLVSRALGDLAGAEAALRRALYLDSGFVAAHYQLGLLLLDRGAAEAARRSIANAARLAQALPGGTVLEEGDGMTAETLLGLARHHLGPAGGLR